LAADIQAHSICEGSSSRRTIHPPAPSVRGP
jgi:hypothetical protein